MQSSGQNSISHIPIPIDPVLSRKEFIRVNLDEQLDQQDIDNFNDMKLSLPCKVYETDSISQTSSKVNTHNKSIGQYLGSGPSSKRISENA